MTAEAGAGRTLPHKKTCPVLCKVDAQACVGLPHAEFEAMYSVAARGFTRDDKLVLNEFSTTFGREYGAGTGLRETAPALHHRGYGFLWKFGAHAWETLT
ncbi:hypothetical protein AURDEDRAFT_171437 [Auricularia subglabra TFB-10046 SS5]|nr:hypothetical protein AURDEDRAFT_171437 [Auricularia subglabra TFB-10046 SS5]